MIDTFAATLIRSESPFEGEFVMERLTSKPDQVKDGLLLASLVPGLALEMRSPYLEREVDVERAEMH